MEHHIFYCANFRGVSLKQKCQHRLSERQQDGVRASKLHSIFCQVRIYSKDFWNCEIFAVSKMFCNDQRNFIMSTIEFFEAVGVEAGERWRRSEYLLTNCQAAARVLSWSRSRQRGYYCPAAGPLALRHFGLGQRHPSSCNTIETTPRPRSGRWQAAERG